MATASQEIRIHISAEGASQAGSAFESAAGKLRKVGESSGFTTQQLGQVHMQLTDIGVSLASGQSPFTVLLQQGGQLKDQFGGVGGAARALGTAVVGMLTPFNLVGAAVFGFGAAAVKGYQESAELRRMLVATGNAAGLTEGSFNALARRVADAADDTIGSAREMTQALAATGRLSSTELEAAARAALRLQQVTGRSSQEIASDFARMAGGVSAWAAESNKSMNFLTKAVYDEIVAAEKAGKTHEAMRLVFEALEEPMKQHRENAGLLERAWWGVKDAASAAADAMLAVGRRRTIEEEIQRVQSALEANRRRTDREDSLGPNGMREGADRQAARLRVELASLQRQRREEQAAVDLRALAASQNRQAIDAERDKPKRERRQNAGDDVLGWFIQDKVDEQDRRDALQRQVDDAWERFEKDYDRRVELARDLGLDLADETARINISLIEDDRERGLAQIELERQTMQARLDALAAGGVDITAQQEALNANVLAKQRALSASMRTEWDRLADYGEDAFAQLVSTGRVDLADMVRSFAAESARDMWRGNVTPLFRKGGEGIKGLFSGGSGSAGDSAADEWEREFGEMIGITSRQNEAATAATRATSLFGQGLEQLLGPLGTAADAVIRFIASMAAGSGGGGGGLNSLFGALGSLFGGGMTVDANGAGLTTGGTSLADYGLGGGRATGGPVRAGYDYIVGENGPERLRMLKSGGGFVTPSGMGGRSQPSFVQNLNVSFAAGVSPAQFAAGLEQLRRHMRAEVISSANRRGNALWTAARNPNT
ncbi:MAG: phage tail length tape measure family protein [Burkholderiales bacterium]|nr:phage tail length tape measure family protein [Burkholderiales bacterium]